MHVGHYISGAGHLGLIGWLLLGDVFAAEPLPFEVQSVSVITGAEFAAMSAVDPVVEAAQVEAPEVAEVPVPEVEEAAEPEPEPQPEPEPAPEPTPPEPEVSEAVPEAVTPPADLSVPVDEVAEEAIAQGADRVAEEAVAEPEPEATPSEEETPAVAPDEAGETPEEPQEAIAPEAATTEIVTEASEEARAAPNQSARPPARRPSRPAPQVAEAEDSSDDQAEAIAAAVAGVQEAETPAAPSGPPLSAGEKEGLRVAVSSCWNVDVGGRSAETVVTVGVSLDRNGKVIRPVRMISAEGGDARSTTVAFQAARRAILLCQKDGYPLPAEKYEHWKEVEMTFNPERMRVK